MKFLISIGVALLSFGAHAHNPERVITIGGSLTEIVYALDAQALLVGSDTTSYFPQEAELLPKVGYQRTLSAEGILSLQPDLVILTDEAGPPPVLKQLQAAKVKLLSLKASRSLTDIRNNITSIGSSLGVEAKASALLDKLDRQILSLNSMLQNNQYQPRVLFILQHGGGAPMVAGNATAATSIIRLSGARNVVSGFNGYKPFTPEAIVNQQPDIILVTDQGLEQVGGVDSLLRIPGLAQTRAGQKRKVISMDSLLLLGFGPRTVQAALELNQMYQDL